MTMVSVKIITTLLLSAIAVAQVQERPCGSEVAACEDGYTCQLPSNCTNMDRCTGSCVLTEPTKTYIPCDTDAAAGNECSADEVCMGDPRTGDCGGPCNMPGICVTPTFCGGFAGIRCPSGLTCYDDPRDDCDPKRGGADCGGVCL